jgi:hypothetical protein
MITRDKAGIFKPRYQANLSHTSFHALFLALFAQSDPKSLKTAAKQQHWLMP